MRHRSRPRARLIPALGAAAALPLLAGPAPASEVAGATVTVEISGLRSSHGLVRACMARQAADFPDCPPAAQAYRASVAAARTVELTFAGVAPGRYAIALLHDENGNGKVDRVLGFMPKEGFGFSRDAPVRMGPPKFIEAAFSVADAPLHLAIRMRYIM